MKFQLASYWSFWQYSISLQNKIYRRTEFIPLSYFWIIINNNNNAFIILCHYYLFLIYLFNNLYIQFILTSEMNQIKGCFVLSANNNHQFLSRFIFSYIIFWSLIMSVASFWESWWLLNMMFLWKQWSHKGPNVFLWLICNFEIVILLVFLLNVLYLPGHVDLTFSLI